MAKTKHKQTTVQRYLLKVPSSAIADAGWTLTVSIPEARKSGWLIALSESQVLRWRDEIRGDLFIDAQVAELRKTIRDIKGRPVTTGNKKLLHELYTELDEVQFVPELIHVVIDRVPHYKRMAAKGFTVNGHTYHRLVGTPGGIKQSTIVFASDSMGAELRRRIDNDRDMTKAFVPAKFEAYRGLTCSGSTAVSFPRGVCVVPDAHTIFKSAAINLTDEGVDEPLMEYVPECEIDLDESDGYGLMLPSLAERWSEELGLHYTAGGFNTRFAWEKGMVFGFDFLDFADNVAHTRIIKDVWGNEVNLTNVELILTESMVKLWDSYKSADDYFASSLRNGYTFGVPKMAPDKLEDEHTLNYQFVQSYDLSDEDIAELTAPTKDEVLSLLDGDYRKLLVYMAGSGITEKNFAKGLLKGGVVSALQIEPELVKDQHVYKQVSAMLKNRMRQAKRGIVAVHGNYSIISGDPVALCQSMFSLPVTGVLKSGEVYNSYWDADGAEWLTAYRAPMTCHNNIRKVSVNRSDEARYWYRFMGTNTVINSWDTMAHALNGAD